MDIIVKNVKRGTEVWNTFASLVRDYKEDISDCLDEYVAFWFVSPRSSHYGKVYKGEDCPLPVQEYGEYIREWIDGNKDYADLVAAKDKVMKDLPSVKWLLENCDRERRYEITITE
jgi:hypothetical protein